MRFLEKNVFFRKKNSKSYKGRMRIEYWQKISGFFRFPSNLLLTLIFYYHHYVYV